MKPAASKRRKRVYIYYIPHSHLQKEGYHWLESLGNEMHVEVITQKLVEGVATQWEDCRRFPPHIVPLVLGPPVGGFLLLIFSLWCWAHQWETYCPSGAGPTSGRFPPSHIVPLVLGPPVGGFLLLIFSLWLSTLEQTLHLLGVRCCEVRDAGNM